MPTLPPPPPDDAPTVVRLGYALRRRREAMPGIRNRQQLAERLEYSWEVVRAVENGHYAARLQRYMTRWEQVVGLDEELHALWRQVQAEEHPATRLVPNRRLRQHREARDETHVTDPAQIRREDAARDDEEADTPVALWEAERDQVLATARASMGRAAAIESATVGAVTLEQLGEEVIGIARAYPAASPIVLWGEMVRLQQRCDELLERTRRPDQIRDLYLVSGQLCGLLAGASFDLGHPDAAAEQAHAARAYAEVIGHRELSAWAAGMIATCAFWSGRAAAAVTHVELGLASSPEGAPQVGLHCIAARAFALMDNAEATRAAIHAAEQTRERADGRSELERIGGQFTFDAARQAFSTGSALLRIGDIMAAAKACATAVELYGADPGSRRGYAARVDLAATHLLRDELDGATQTLEPVFALPPAKRVATIVKRLNDVYAILSRPRFRKARQTAQVTARITEFSTDTALRALPAPAADHREGDRRR